MRYPNFVIHIKILLKFTTFNLETVSFHLIYRTFNLNTLYSFKLETKKEKIIKNLLSSLFFVIVQNFLIFQAISLKFATNNPEASSFLLIYISLYKTLILPFNIQKESKRIFRQSTNPF